MIALDQELAWLARLEPRRRAHFLAILSHNLTVAMRVFGYSDADLNLRLECMKLTNEIQHRVTSYISHHLAEDEDPGWLHVVVDYVLACKHPTVAEHMNFAWHSSRRAFGP